MPTIPGDDQRMTEEGRIKKEIVDFLSVQPYCYFKVVQIGGIRGRSNTAKGMADIIGVWNSKGFAIEVKTKTGKLSPEQDEFLFHWRRCGGLAIVARSLEDVVRLFRAEGYPAVVQNGQNLLKS